jgi:hypothetical protein
MKEKVLDKKVDRQAIRSDHKVAKNYTKAKCRESTKYQHTNKITLI